MRISKAEQRSASNRLALGVADNALLFLHPKKSASRSALAPDGYVIPLRIRSSFYTHDLAN